MNKMIKQDRDIYNGTYIFRNIVRCIDNMDSSYECWGHIFSSRSCVRSEFISMQLRARSEEDSRRDRPRNYSVTVILADIPNGMYCYSIKTEIQNASSLNACRMATAIMSDTQTVSYM